MPRILHFADLHLGAPFRQFGPRGKLLREGLKKTLENIIAAAQKERADLVLCAGDLVDANQVSPATVDFIAAQLGKLDVPVVIQPGTHDCYDRQAVYKRQVFARLPNVQIATAEEGQTFEFPSLSLAVHIKANTASRSPVSPLAGLTPHADFRWNVAVAHGSLQIPGKAAADDYPITFDQLAASGMDYVALGHWHNFYEVTSTSPLACYAGAAGTLSWTESDSGTACLVDLDDSGVRVTRLSVAYHRWHDAECAFDEVEARLTELKGDTSLLRLTVRGDLPEGGAAKLAELTKRWQNAFFHLEIRSPASPSVAVNLDQVNENTFAGQFLLLAKERLAQAAPEDKNLLAKVLARGCQILTAGEVD